VFIAFFSCLVLFPAGADMPLKGEVREIIDDFNGFEFREADEKLSSFDKAYPHSFYTPFLHSYKQYWRFLLAPYHESVAEELQRKVEETIDLCEREEFDSSGEAKLIKGCAYVFLSALIFEGGRPLASLKWLNKGIQEVKSLETDPELKGDVAFILGSYQLYRVIRDTDKALALLETARKEGVYFTALARLVTARIYQRGQEDAEKSLPIYRELNREYPNNPLVSYYLAKNLQMTRQYRESIETFEKTLSIINFDPPPLEMLCLIHFSSGQIYENVVRSGRDAAREYLAAYKLADRAVEETTWFIPWSSLHLGMVYAKMNDRETALQWLNKVEKNDDRRAWEKAARLIRDLSP